MKTLICTLSLAATSLSFSAAADVTPANNDTSSSICAIAANEKPNKLRKALRKVNRNVHIAARNITCNGVPLKEFTKQQAPFNAKLKAATKQTRVAS